MHGFSECLYFYTFFQACYDACHPKALISFKYHIGARNVFNVSRPEYEINGSHDVYRLHETQNHQLNQKSSRSTRRIAEFCFYLVKADKRDF